MIGEIVCSGFGGQGVLVAGMILAYAGMGQDKYVTWFPSYGAEMRGGTANCNVKISEDEIASPYVKEIDVLLAMNETSVDKFENQIKAGGVMVVNSSIVSPNRDFRSDIKVVKVPANEIARREANPKGLNIIMLGAMAGATEIFEPDYLKSAVDKYFADKGKVNPKNSLCFDAGINSCII
ncbi:MAG: 2-oxoacid:acceptor oxidoreductase family protein [Eubacteriaceae bacterium]|jgi:2-oxoglutarate ferredoxin oxidoreductase subunit gamma|nr:2-oxoacid:acceptor oxidoreductase family protein [Eubacteriaceae bacterium]